MSHTRDDKSAQEVYYKPEGEHGRAECDDHTNLLALSEAPVLHPLVSLHHQTASIQAIKKTNTQLTRRIPPRRMALCGGGVRGIAHVGVMKALEEAGLLIHIKEVIGISAGAFFSLLWILDYTVAQIEQLSLELDFTKLRNIQPETVLSFPLTFGLDDGQGIEKLIGSVLKQKGLSPEATFEQVAVKYPKHLRCFATELQTSKVREFSTVKTPKTSVKFAIRASMSLPLFYTPVKEESTGALLMDGALLNNLPLVFLNEYEIRETWGVLFAIEQGTKIAPVDDIMELIRYIYDSSKVMKSVPYIDKFSDRLILIPTNEFSALNFEEPREERKKLIDRAHDLTKKFIYSYSKSSTPLRRFSAC